MSDSTAGLMQSAPQYFSTLPREFYLPGEVFELEMERIWSKQWLYLAHGSEIPDAGDYILRNILGESILVIRGADSEIRVFMNVCRHRGSRLIDAPCGRLRHIICPYHRWSYDLAGRLLGAPSMPDGEELDYAAWGLHSLAVDQWHGLVFACLGDQPPPPVSDEIDQAAPLLAQYRPEQLRKVTTRVFEIAANWKVVLENYVECYHCVGSHPEFCATTDVRALDQELRGAATGPAGPYWFVDHPLTAGYKTVSLDGEYVCKLPLPGARAAGADGQSRSFAIHPALTTAYFYADYVTVHEIRPTSATGTEFYIHWLVADEAGEEDVDLGRLRHIWEVTTEQDAVLCERTQLGVRSRHYVPGPISSRREPGIRATLESYTAVMGSPDPAART